VPYCPTVDRVQPTYLVIDTSASMGGRVHEIEALLSDLQQHLLETPLLADLVRLAVLTFDDRASLELPLSDITEISDFPVIRIGGGTRISSVFELLRHTIARDLLLLRTRETLLFRPFVVFITDGIPTEPEHLWTSEYQKLLAAVNPRILAVGLPGAPQSLLNSIGNFATVQLGSVQSIAAFLMRGFESLTASVVTTMPTDLSASRSSGPRNLEPRDLDTEWF